MVVGTPKEIPRLIRIDKDSGRIRFHVNVIMNKEIQNPKKNGAGHSTDNLSPD